MKKTILILLCGWFAIMATRAQCAAQNEAIQAGEELVYDLKFNWKFIWDWNRPVHSVTLPSLFPLNLIRLLTQW